MKKTNLFYALLMLGALASCKKDNTGNAGTEQVGTGKVNFTLSGNNGDPTFRTGHTPGTGKLVVSWQKLDKVGLFSIVGTETKNANAAFTILEDKDITEAGKKAMFSGELTQSGDWSMDFYAYYPHAANQADAKKIAVSVADQVIDGKESKHLAKYDVLVADPVKGVAAGATNTTLNFKHVMAIADLNISLPAGAETQQVKEIKILRPDSKRIFTSGTIDITAATDAERLKITSAEAQSSYAQVTPVQNVSLAAGESFHARLALLPADWSSETVSIYVTTDKGTYQFDKASIKTEAGKRYNSDLKLETKVAVNVGDFYYADGTWSATLNANKKLVGIVAYKGQKGGAVNGFVVSLNDAFWTATTFGKNPASALFNAPTIPNLPRLTNPTRPDGEDWDGYDHAKTTIPNRADANYAGLNFIWMGVDYDPIGVTEGAAIKGQWYTPAVSQMRAMYDNIGLLESKLSAASATTLKGKGYWSSTEFWGGTETHNATLTHLWRAGFSFSGLDLYSGNTQATAAGGQGFPVRPFLNF